MRFRRSRLYISIIPPVILGIIVGMLTAVMGIGGGFIMIPAMIYLLRMPTNVVIGTSQFQILFVTAAATILHAASDQTVDIVLAFLLVAGGVIGVQMGVRVGSQMRGEQLRALLAVLVLSGCAEAALRAGAHAGGHLFHRGGHAVRGRRRVVLSCGDAVDSVDSECRRSRLGSFHRPHPDHVELHGRGHRAVRRHRASRKNWDHRATRIWSS